MSLISRKEIFEHFGREIPLFFEHKNDGITLSFQVNDAEAACQYLKKKGTEVVRSP